MRRALVALPLLVAAAALGSLEMLFFRFGRYLLISSRPGTLPANLQGIWNDLLAPSWEASSAPKGQQVASITSGAKSIPFASNVNRSIRASLPPGSEYVLKFADR